MDVEQNSQVADILASVTAYNRMQLSEELREIGPKRFVEKYSDISLLPRNKAPVDWPTS